MLDTGKNHKKEERRRKRGRVEQLVECGSARVDKSGDSLRMLGVGEALEEAGVGVVRSVGNAISGLLTRGASRS